jgi:hypothetical protein
VYARANKKDVVLVILNPSGKEATARFDLPLKYAKTSVLAGKALKLQKKDSTVTVTVPGQTYSIIKLL